MIEDELRAAFDRHEDLVPAASRVLPGIEHGYRRRRRRLLGTRVGGATVLVVALIAGSAAGASWVNQGAPSHPADITTPGPVPPGAVNFLVLGLDGNTDSPAPRSDTVLIVHIPASHDRADLVTIERDTRVTIPAAGSYAGGSDKINTAYLGGGAALVAQTIRQNWGIAIDGTATFTYQALEHVITVLGGVDLYVDSETTSTDIGYRADGSFAKPFTLDGRLRAVPGVTPVVYHVGKQHLAPWQALDFVRQRMLIADNGGAYSRDRHVRQLVRAVLATALQPRDPGPSQATPGTATSPDVAANALNAALTGGATVDAGGTSLANLLVLARSLGSITSIGVPGAPAGSGGLAWEQLTPVGLDLLAAVRGDTVDQWIAAHPNLVDSR